MDKKLEKISRILEEKKGEDITILYVGRQTWIADYFVIVTGNSQVHSRTLAENLLEKFGEAPVSVDGMQNGKWILLDYAEIMVHIFLSKTREHYKLEKLWAEV